MRTHPRGTNADGLCHDWAEKNNHGKQTCFRGCWIDLFQRCVITRLRNAWVMEQKCSKIVETYHSNKKIDENHRQVTFNCVFHLVRFFLWFSYVFMCGACFFSLPLLFSCKRVQGYRAVLMGSLQAQAVFILASLQISLRCMLDSSRTAKLSNHVTKKWKPDEKAELSRTIRKEQKTIKHLETENDQIYPPFFEEKLRKMRGKIMHLNNFGEQNLKINEPKGPGLHWHRRLPLQL